MKKLILILAGTISLLIIENQFVTAQNPSVNKATLLPIAGNAASISRPVQPTKDGFEVLPAKGVASSEKNQSSTSTLFQAVGTTTYDLQTNASVCQRIYRSNSGLVGLSFTKSDQLGGSFPDRGTAYDFNDGSGWSGASIQNIDTLAWSSIDIGANNTEYVLGHNLISAPNDLVLIRCSPAGSMNWTKSYLPPHPAGNTCLWARMRVGGTNGMTIHVISLTRPASGGGTPFNGIDGALTYSRSQDGGNTWDLVHVLLPMVDAAHYSGMQADSYALDVKNNTVVITQGSLYNDWVMWKSPDNGTTWSRTLIKAFPIPAYDFNTMITDVNGDAVADTVDHIDGSQAVIIDNNNMVHCFVGRMRLYEDSVTVPEVFPATDGMLYWNESFGAAQPIIITTTQDNDGSGTLEFAEGIQGFTSFSLTTNPTVAIDGGSNIFLTYSGVVEQTSNGMPGPLELSYRNIYIIMSPDNGSSWSVPVRMNPSDFDECVYPSIARNVSDSLHIVYQTDFEPGIAVSSMGPYGNNDIIYFAEDPEDAFNGVTIIPYYFNKLEGNVYIDQNQNGNKDVGENGMMYSPLSLSPGNFSTQTNTNGDYLFAVDSGTYVINLTLSNDWIITSDSLSYTIEVDSALISGLDFGVYPVNSTYDVSINLTSGIPRCNNYINYWISFRNEGTMPTSGVVKFIMDDQLTYESSVPAYTTASADTFYWNFTNLYPSEQRIVNIVVSSFAATLGDTLSNCATTNYDDGATGSASEDCSTQIVVCSWDPNDKAAVPIGVGAQHQTLLTDTLLYTIRFQNTGTDTAFVVRVIDTLDTNLDPATFSFIASSHPVDITRQQGNVFKFDFGNILLPDSNVNEPGSNGFVKYSILPYAGTASGTYVDNTAYIFFDFNPAIITNTTYNTLVDVIIGTPEIESEKLMMRAQPNPFSHETTIIFSSELKQPHSISVVDLSGREILNQTGITGYTKTISSGKFTSGMYFCVLKDQNDKITGIQKLIVY